MSTSDACILTPILLTTIGALIAIRVTFRNAVTVRDAVFGPVVFGVCGALIGISIGMVWFADREGRVRIEEGLLLLLCGAGLGGLVGAAAKRVYPRLNRGKAAAFVLVVALLGGSIGAPIGWVVGSVDTAGASEYDTRSDSEQALKRWTRRQMMWGIGIGSGIGLLLGLATVMFQRRGAT